MEDDGTYPDKGDNTCPSCLGNGGVGLQVQEKGSHGKGNLSDR